MTLVNSFLFKHKNRDPNLLKRRKILNNDFNYFKIILKILLIQFI